MEENVFLIKWYGPFKSIEEVKGWEEKQSFCCSLYLLHGKLKYAKTKDSYYCGESTRNISKRFKDKGHHIEEIEERLNSIYVGCLSNVKRPTRSQIMLAEKIVTAYLSEAVGDRLLNETNKYYPSQNVYVINEWWKPNGVDMWKRQPHNSPSNIVPDVLSYHYKGNDDNLLFGCRKLKQL
jgi:hypothetical protein